jgi:hypothetical protein
MVSIKEAIRRVYHDMVRRRATVRIIDSSEVTLDSPPIFLVGVYRSGTTLLRYIIDSHSHICCPPETDFISPLSQLVQEHMYRRGFREMGFDEEYVLNKLREFVNHFFGNYARSHDKSRWADKSPSYIDSLDWIRQLFPESQFIMIYRNGLDQAHSYTRGGTFMRTPLKGYCADGEDLRVGAIRYWCDQVEKMFQFEERYPDQCFQMTYEKLCEKPEAVLKSMFEFINEPWEQNVLSYYEYPHDKGREDGRVGVTRGITVSKDHFKKWHRDIFEQCYALAKPSLARIGYASLESPDKNMREASTDSGGK